MVCRNDNQSFVRMLVIKIQCFLYGFCKVFHFIEDGGCIIIVAGPVNFSSLCHEKETVFIVFCQKTDGILGDLG